MTESTSSIYNRAAGHWARNEPVLLSDYTARPFVLEALEPLAGARVLDLGCGEGYVARQMVERGARQVVALDVSSGMIERAIAAETGSTSNITYAVKDAAGSLEVERGSFDLAVAVFLFNYLDLAQMQTVMRNVHDALGEGGRFVFTVPHPLLPFVREKEEPFWFDRGESGYFSGRNTLFEGRIWRRDGVDVPVRCIHKTFSDYFAALAEAGFVGMPGVTELRVTEEHLALDPTFFGPLAEQPLHVMFEVER